MRFELGQTFGTLAGMTRPSFLPKSRALSGQTRVRSNVDGKVKKPPTGVPVTHKQNPHLGAAADSVAQKAGSVPRTSGILDGDAGQRILDDRRLVT